MIGGTTATQAEVGWMDVRREGFVLNSAARALARRGRGWPVSPHEWGLAEELAAEIHGTGGPPVPRMGREPAAFRALAGFASEAGEMAASALRAHLLAITDVLPGVYPPLAEAHAALSRAKARIARRIAGRAAAAGGADEDRALEGTVP